MAETKFIQIMAGAQALLAAWATLTSATAGTQPLIACESAHSLRAGAPAPARACSSLFRQVILCVIWSSV